MSKGREEIIMTVHLRRHKGTVYANLEDILIILLQLKNAACSDDAANLESTIHFLERAEDRL